jgi:serine/threonine protein kinase
VTNRQWGKVKQLFTKAAPLDRRERATFLRDACPDEGIRREVKSLLTQHDKPENFLGVYSSIGGKTLSHYEIQERIGAGGMAVVYKAHDTRLERWVAIKVLQPWAMARSGSDEQLFNEARCASALNHPNIVTVHDVGQENGVCFMVMEYVPGETLGRLIPAAGLPLQDAIPYAIQIANALATAHAGGIAHGDLKPANIRVTDGGQVKLLDFGLARALAAGTGQSEPGRPSARFGTKAYMAPELLNDRRLDPDPRSEIFSFGLILHQMLTGIHAFGAGTRDELVEAIRSNPPNALPKNVPASLVKIVRRCLQKSPEQRFESMREILQALTTCRTPKSAQSPRLAEYPAPSRATPETHPERTAGTGFTDSAGIQQVQATLERIGYQNIPKSRHSLGELDSLMERAPSQAMRQQVTSALKDLILTIPDFNNGIPAPVRQLRKEALDLIKTATQGQLRECFKEKDLEYLDLYGMNFAGQRLTDISFRGCFLVEADFRQSHLDRATFAGAYVRNVNFAGADLSGADFTDADWFNALALTGGQLASARQDTLMQCPPDEEAMHRYLAARYAFPFESWPLQVQEQLKAAWSQYLLPKGLRDLVAQWRRKSR